MVAKEKNICVRETRSLWGLEWLQKIDYLFEKSINNCHQTFPRRNLTKFIRCFLQWYGHCDHPSFRSVAMTFMLFPASHRPESKISEWYNQINQNDKTYSRSSIRQAYAFYLLNTNSMWKINVCYLLIQHSLTRLTKYLWTVFRWCGYESHRKYLSTTHCLVTCIIYRNIACSFNASLLVVLCEFVVFVFTVFPPNFSKWP